MTYPIKNIRAVLIEARRLQKEDDKARKALKQYWQLVSTNHVPVRDKDAIYGFLQAIEAAYGVACREDVEYWIYEVPNLSRLKNRIECIGKSGKKYDAANLGSYIAFLNDLE